MLGAVAAGGGEKGAVTCILHVKANFSKEPSQWAKLKPKNHWIQKK